MKIHLDDIVLIDVHGVADDREKEKAFSKRNGCQRPRCIFENATAGNRFLFVAHEIEDESGRGPREHKTCHGHFCLLHQCFIAVLHVCIVLRWPLIGRGSKGLTYRILYVLW